MFKFFKGFSRGERIANIIGAGSSVVLALGITNPLAVAAFGIASFACAANNFIKASAHLQLVFSETYVEEYGRVEEKYQKYYEKDYEKDYEDDHLLTHPDDFFPALFSIVEIGAGVFFTGVKIIKPELGPAVMSLVGSVTSYIGLWQSVQLRDKYKPLISFSSSLDLVAPRGPSNRL